LIAAMYEAFAQDREFTVRYVLQLSRRASVANNDRAGNSLENWARQRARPAATSVAEYHGVLKLSPAITGGKG